MVPCPQPPAGCPWSPQAPLPPRASSPRLPGKSPCPPCLGAFSPSTCLCLSCLPLSLSLRQGQITDPKKGQKGQAWGRRPLQRPGSHEWRWEQAAQSLPGLACDSILREAQEAEEMLMPSRRAHPGSKGHGHRRCADPPWAHNSDTAWPPTRLAERHCQWSHSLQALHTMVMAGLPSWVPHPRGWAWPARVHRHQLCGEFSPSSPCCLPLRRPSVHPLHLG